MHSLSEIIERNNARQAEFEERREQRRSLLSPTQTVFALLREVVRVTDEMWISSGVYGPFGEYECHAEWPELAEVVKEAKEVLGAISSSGANLGATGNSSTPNSSQGQN